MKTRVIICAAGSRARWGNHLGLPKQYIHFNGTPLLQRTISHVRGFGMVTDVLVTAVEPPPEGIVIEGAEFVCPPPDAPLPDSGSGNSFAFWTDDPEDCTVILFGDVYYSPFCLQNVFVSAAMTNQSGGLGLHYFGRRGGGDAEGGGANGKDWGEIWAWLIRGRGARARWAEAVAAAKARAGDGCRLLTSWEVLDFLTDRKDYYWTEIRDETEDFDTPTDLDKWIKLYPALWAPLKG